MKQVTTITNKLCYQNGICYAYKNSQKETDRQTYRETVEFVDQW